MTLFSKHEVYCKSKHCPQEKKVFSQENFASSSHLPVQYELDALLEFVPVDPDVLGGLRVDLDHERCEPQRSLLVLLPPD